MNNNQLIPQELYERIENYLLGEMSDEEKVAFNTELAGSDLLQQQVEHVRLLLVGIREVGLNDKMQEFHAAMSTDETVAPAKVVKGGFLKRWLVAAAVIVVAALAGWWLLLRGSEPEKIFATYYSADPGLITAMSASANYDFDRAMVDYKTGQYDKALAAWQKMLATNPQNDTLNYFAGTASLAAGHSAIALPYFEKVISQTNSVFFTDANWYAGLALLKESRKAEAVAYIKKSDHPQAAALLLKLEHNGGK